MRVLALGCTLPDAQVDNYDWASALSFHDYDAIVVDPAEGVSKFIDSITRSGEAFVTYADEPVEDGPTTSHSIGLADLLRARRDETDRLLSRGGLVVCFAYPDVAHANVTGFTGCHRYYWLAAPFGTDYGPAFVKPASGIHVKATDYEHPFADYLERFRNNVLYRASFVEGAAGFGAAGKVIGRSPGGAAIAIDLSVGGGRVIFLPALPPRLSQGERGSIAAAMVSAIRNTLLLQAEERPPDWLEDYPLPGLAEAKRRLSEAEERFAQAEEELDDARNALRAIEVHQRLLWQEGKYGFELPVRDALAMLGFSNYSRPDEPASLYYSGETILLEAQASRGAVGMEPHYRLRERLEQKIAQEGRRPRGLIVINGYREQPPTERPQQYEDPLRVAAESMRYCVLHASDLLEAVRARMEGRDSGAEFCRRLIETEGIFLPAGAGASAPNK